MLQYAITDRRFFPGDERQRHQRLLDQADALSSAGIDFLQLREKDLSAGDLLALATALRRRLPPGAQPRLLLNAPLSLAIEARADGLHLPGGWTARDIAAARTAFAEAGQPRALLSISAHTLPEVHAAHSAGADLILFGPIFEKRVDGNLVRPGLGLQALSAAAQAATATPVLALGGVTSATISACLNAGAAGIAAIRLFLPAAASHPVAFRPTAGSDMRK